MGNVTQLRPTRASLPSRLADRLVVLLSELQKPEQQAEMAEMERRLAERDLWSGGLEGEVTPARFAQAVIEDNAALKESLSFNDRQMIPSTFETVADLVSNLMPSDGHLD
jgi:hypothetical protein